jgi:hypothetical protein
VGEGASSGAEMAAFDTRNRQKLRRIISISPPQPYEKAVFD